jgi:phage gp29-like protein
VTVTVCSDDVPVPTVFVAFRWIYHVPTPKVYVGFWVVLNEITVLFPVLFRKYQIHDVGLFVDVSVNATDKGAVPLDGDSVKLATGTACVTVTVCSDDVPVPTVFVAFRWIYHVPTPNVYSGFWAVLNCVTVLFPVLFRKYQTHDVGLFVEVSVNNTAVGAVPPVTFFVKLATGTGCVTVTVCSAEVPVPPVFVAFRWIYHVPTPKVYSGFWAVLNEITVLFPVLFRKYQIHDVGLFVEVSVNNTAVGAVPEDTFSVKLATGVGGSMVTVCSAEVPVPPEFVAFK